MFEGLLALLKRSKLIPGLRYLCKDLFSSFTGIIDAEVMMKHRLPIELGVQGDVGI